MIAKFVFIFFVLFGYLPLLRRTFGINKPNGILSRTGIRPNEFNIEDRNPPSKIDLHMTPFFTMTVSSKLRGELLSWVTDESLRM